MNGLGWLDISANKNSLFGSIALLSINTLKWSGILGLSFLCGAGGPGNPYYGVQAYLMNFALHFQKC